MNKLLGFYELRDSTLPSIPWKIYKPGTKLSDEYLWTIRSAVLEGDDLNLPRSIGKSAKESVEFANDLYNKLGDKGIVIYYHYFVARKSSTLEVALGFTSIEAVADDLWNLVTDHKLDVSLTYDMEDNLIASVGNKDFLGSQELDDLLANANKVRKLFRDYLLEGKSVLLEWSLASNYLVFEGQDEDDCYLVFYEARTI